MENTESEFDPFPETEVGLSLEELFEASLGSPQSVYEDRLANYLDSSSPGAYALDLYDQLQPHQIQHRWFMLHVAGEAGETANLQRLNDIATGPLPPPTTENVGHGHDLHSYELMLQVRAAKAICATPDVASETHLFEIATGEEASSTIRRVSIACLLERGHDVESIRQQMPTPDQHLVDFDEEEIREPVPDSAQEAVEVPQ